MKNPLIFIFAILLLNLACRTSSSSDVSNINTININLNSTSSQVKIFTAANLTEYVQRDSTELDKMLIGNRIMVSGVVTAVEDNFIELEGNNRGKIKCSGAVFYQDEWKKLKRFYSNFNKTRAKRPLATVSGIYKSSVKANVFLEECKIETVTK
jgi:hypothetical protein